MKNKITILLLLIALSFSVASCSWTGSSEDTGPRPVEPAPQI